MTNKDTGVRKKEMVSVEWVLSLLAGMSFPEQGQAHDFVKKAWQAVKEIRETTREYTEDLDTSIGDLMTIEEWKDARAAGEIVDYDGYGYWVKDGKVNEEDDVFETEPLDATHVIWYNK